MHNLEISSQTLERDYHTIKKSSEITIWLATLTQLFI